MGLTDALTYLVRREELPPAVARAAMTTILSGEATDAQIAGFAVSLRAKGETPAELAALVDTMLQFAERVAHTVPVHALRYARSFPLLDRVAAEIGRLAGP